MDTDHDRMERYQEALTLYAKHHAAPPDRNWKAFLWLLTGAYGRFWPTTFVDWKGREVSPAILEPAYSSTERILIELAWHLFTGENTVDLYAMACRLGDEQWRDVLTALAIIRE